MTPARFPDGVPLSPQGVEALLEARTFFTAAAREQTAGSQRRCRTAGRASGRTLSD